MPLNHKQRQVACVLTGAATNTNVESPTPGSPAIKRQTGAMHPAIIPYLKRSSAPDYPRDQPEVPPKATEMVARLTKVAVKSHLWCAFLPASQRASTTQSRSWNHKSSLKVSQQHKLQRVACELTRLESLSRSRSRRPRCRSTQSRRRTRSCTRKQSLRKKERGLGTTSNDGLLRRGLGSIKRRNGYMCGLTRA